MTTPAEEIDRLLAAEKALFAPTRWTEDTSTATLAAPILREGIIVGGLRIQASTPFRVTPQRGDIVLIFDQRPICRLALNPKHAHANPGGHPVPADLRFLTLAAGRSRIYRWQDNRTWPRGANDILAGRLLEREPASLAAAIDSFLAECHIIGAIPEPPWRPELNL